MTLSEALERCRGAVVVQADESFYEDCFDRMGDALEIRCSSVERGEMGCLFADIGGMAPQYGGEARLIASLLQAAPSQFDPRLGLASTKFTAYAAALGAAPGRAVRDLGDPAVSLSALPVELPPISREGIPLLRRRGVRTLGDLASRPASAARTPLGAESLRARELAQGVGPGRLPGHSRAAA